MTKFNAQGKIVRRCTSTIMRQNSLRMNLVKEAYAYLVWVWELKFKSNYENKSLRACVLLERFMLLGCCMM
jgi:hypothetical protein